MAEFQTFTNKFGTPSAAWERRPLAAASSTSSTVVAGPDVAMEPLNAHGGVHGASNKTATGPRPPTPALPPYAHGPPSYSAANAPPPSNSTVSRVSNSTSTIYARNLVSNLDSDEVLSAIASVLHTLLSQQGANALAMSGGVAPPVDVNFSCFDERSYVPREARKKLRWAWPSTTNTGLGAYYSGAASRSSRRGSSPPLPDDSHEGVPPKEEMFKFLCRASRRASFSPENTVIALIILNRVLSCTPRLVVHAYNWRLLYLSALLVAQKLYDDVSLDNASFPIVWRAAVGAEASGLPPDSLDVRAFNDMEAKILELVRFNVFIPRSLYASFCFELRTIFEAENPTLAFPVTPLSPDDAARLESRTLALPRTLASSVKPRTSKSHMETTEGASVGVSRGVGPRAVLS